MDSEAEMLKKVMQGDRFRELRDLVFALSHSLGITQIRCKGRGIGFHLSAGPNPQLPVDVHYSRAF